MNTFIRFVCVVLPLVLIISAGVVVPLKLFDPKGLARVERLRLDLAEIQEKNRKIARENEMVREKIQAFHSDPEYIEKVARDELGMIGKDEIIYQFPEQ